LAGQEPHRPSESDVKVDVGVRSASLGGVNDILGRALIVHADDCVSSPLPAMPVHAWRAA
jgi:hypothetical protein